jgi:Outer membrane lipoprotein carrier protein LolA-like
MNFGAGLPNVLAGVCALSLACGMPPAGVALANDAVPSAQSEWTMEQLISRLKAQREPTVAYEEKSYSSLLTEPLSSKGVLRFTPPARMEKEIREPYRERYVIDGDRVLVESARKGIQKTIALDDYPALRSLVEAFRATFTGNVARLMNRYDTTIGGDRRQWTLLLRPRDPEGRTLVDYILFTGSDGRIETIAIRAPDGDRTVMTLHRKPSP